MEYGLKTRAIYKQITARGLSVAEVEQTNNKLYMVLLDWEKAFDKVDKQGLMEALRRMRVPQKYVNIIQSLHTNTQFNVEIEGHSSTWKTQETGIKQGCPLSPYLFLVVMTVLFADIYKKIGATLIKHRVPGTDYNEVLYADDTICITTDTKTMNTYLKEIGTEGAKYRLKLSRSRCKAMHNTQTADIHFSNQDQVQRKDMVK